MIEAETVHGYRIAIDRSLGIGLMALPDPSTDVTDPQPSEALTMHELGWDRAMAAISKRGITPWEGPDGYVPTHHIDGVGEVAHLLLEADQSEITVEDLKGATLLLVARLRDLEDE